MKQVIERVWAPPLHLLKELHVTITSFATLRVRRTERLRSFSTIEDDVYFCSLTSSLRGGTIVAI